MVVKKKDKPRLLNLGSGNRPGDKKMGWINIDIDKGCNPDIVRDLDTVLPFDDNSIDYVRASHIIEHVKDVFFFMKEIWRVSKNNRIVEIIAPNHAHLMSIYANHHRFIRSQYFEMWHPNYEKIGAVMNVNQETYGATFVSLEETIVENSGAIKFVLQVVKDEPIKKPKKLVLNLGCGVVKLKDKDKNIKIVNIDIDQFNEPDRLLDIERGLPYADNSIDQIMSTHFLEHISPDKMNFVMYEIWRVLKKGKKFKCVVPIGLSWATSPFHKAPMSEYTPVFFTEWNDINKTGYDFKLIKREKVIGKVDGKEVDWSDELHFELEVIKDG